MIDVSLRAQAASLSGFPDSNVWWYMGWMWLGYDVAASGVPHYTLALRDLWPGERPCPQALDLFRAGFAAYRSGRQRPTVGC